MNKMRNKLELVVLQIDLARQKETVEYVKNYIDFAKENGYNTVLLYLESGVRVPCAPFLKEEETYSEDEIREIVAYATEKGMDLIPGLENLAHIEKFLQYPEMAYLSECTDAAVDGRGIREGLGDSVCVSNPEAAKFLDTYYTQVISLFPGKYVHAGMDEPFDFAVCPRCTQRLQNGETKEDLFYAHLMRTYNLIKGMGKTMMMWDDFFQYMDIVDRLPRDIIMTNWNYGFITDEPDGFWLNRKKKDWLRYYEQLGFRYLFCTFANRTSKLFNVDSFSNYADKYHPMGAVMTAWCRTEIFYFCSYPAIAYAGRFWSGKATVEDREEIYAQLLGSREAAQVVLYLEARGDSHHPNNLQICENLSQFRYNNTLVTGYAVHKLEEILSTMQDSFQKEVLADVHCLLMDNYLELLQHNLCMEAFDNYETRALRPAYFVKKLEKMKQLSLQQKAHGEYMWKKYRSGIRSCNDDFTRKFENREKLYSDMITQLQENKKYGVFYAEIMLHSIWGTPRIVVEIHYKDKSIPVTIHRTKPKVDTGVNTVRFRMENKPVDYVVYTVHGEGASYPCHFRYTCNGKKYVASSATKLCGEVKDLKRVLLDDTQFAQVGNDDGQAHFNDINVSKTEHKIKLKFKRMK